MANVSLIAVFDLNFIKAEPHTICRSDEELADFIASCVAYNAGGYRNGSGSVTSPDDIGRPVAVPGRFYISVRIPEILVKFHEVAPETLLHELFPPDYQEKYGVSNITLHFQESTTKLRK